MTNRINIICYFTALVAAAPIMIQPSEAAASGRCLTGASAANGATGAGDLAEIEAVRASIDAACACDSFPSRREYLRCARAELRNYRDGSVLRRQCVGQVRRIVSQSSCSRRPHRLGEFVPCLRRRTNGMVGCSIRPLTSCERVPSRVGCTDFDFCIDAADSDGDLLLTALDSGECGCPPLVVDNVKTEPSIVRGENDFVLIVSWTLAAPTASLEIDGSFRSPFGAVFNFERALTEVAAGSHTEEFAMTSSPASVFVNGIYPIEATVATDCTSASGTGTFQVQ